MLAFFCFFGIDATAQSFKGYQWETLICKARRNLVNGRMSGYEIVKKIRGCLLGHPLIYL